MKNRLTHHNGKGEITMRRLACSLLVWIGFRCVAELTIDE